MTGAKPEDFNNRYREWLGTKEGELATTEFAENIYGDSLQSAVNSVILVVDAFNKFANLINENRRNIADALLAIKNNLPKYHRDLLASYAEISTLLGWPPTLQIPWKAIVHIAELHNNDANRDQVQIFIRELWFQWFDETNIRQIIGEWWHWEKVMANRRPLLEQAIEAHFEGRYALSVPVFLAQFEGIVAAIFHHSGKLHGHGVKTTKGISYLQGLVDASKDELYDCGSILRYAERVPFSPFKVGDPIVTINRHAILHGVDTGYNTRERSLQAILLLDILLTLLGWIASDTDKTFHRPGCLLLASLCDTPSSALSIQPKVYQSAEAAEAAGYKPCRVCVAQESES